MSEGRGRKVVGWAGTKAQGALGTAMRGVDFILGGLGATGAGKGQFWGLS